MSDSDDLKPLPLITTGECMRRCSKVIEEMGRIGPTEEDLTWNRALWVARAEINAMRDYDEMRNGFDGLVKREDVLEVLRGLRREVKQ